MSMTLVQELLDRISSRANGATEKTIGKSIATAIEDSISGVFGLSAKLALFYGLWTWFVHSLFGLGIDFIPSGIMD